jgi:uncharacterized membrane protein YkoI
MKVLRLAALAAAILLVSQTPVSAQRTGKAGKGEEKPKVIQIDLSKLPPDLAKALQDFTKKQKKSRDRRGEKKGAADAISLSEAIGIAEKAGKGRATSANRKDGLDYTHFTVTVAHADGTTTRFTLSGTGKILQQRKSRKDRD